MCNTSPQELALLRSQSLKLSVARVALDVARQYIITMHGDPRNDPFGDKILGAILTQIEEGLKP